MDDKKHTGAKGLSFTSCLTLIFVVLKLTGLINWSWLWVLSPLWIGFAVVLVLMVLFLFFCMIVSLINDFIRDDI